MRKYLLVILSVFVAYHGQCQFKFGILGGGNISDFTSSVSRTVNIGGNNYSGNLNASANFGYQFGGIIRYDQPEWSIDINGIYADHSVKWHGGLDNGSNEVRNSLELDLKQIEIPIIGYYKIPLETCIFRFGLGFYGSYGFGNIRVNDKYSNVPGNVLNIATSQSWSNFGFNAFNAGVLLAVGTDFKLGSISTLGVELRGQTTFSDYADKLNPNIGLGGSAIGLLTISGQVSYVF